MLFTGYLGLFNDCSPSAGVTSVPWRKNWSMKKVLRKITGFTQQCRRLVGQGQSDLKGHSHRLQMCTATGSMAISFTNASRIQPLISHINHIIYHWRISNNFLQSQYKRKTWLMKTLSKSHRRKKLFASLHITSTKKIIIIEHFSKLIRYVSTAFRFHWLADFSTRPTDDRRLSLDEPPSALWKLSASESCQDSRVPRRRGCQVDRKHCNRRVRSKVTNALQ